MPRDKENNKRWQKEYRKKQRLKHPEKYLYQQARRRAKDSGLEFDITPDDIIIPDKCPLLDIELKLGDGKSRSCSPSLDRIDSSKGYVKGNISVISMKANSCKSDLSLQEIERMYQYVSGLQITQSRCVCGRHRDG